MRRTARTRRLLGMAVAAAAALSSTAVSLAAVPAYAAADGDNLALNRPATQNTTAYGGVASRAVDGNTDGNFYDNSTTHTDSTAQAWWQVDLGAVDSIADIVVWNRTDCCSNRLTDFYVLVSSTPFASNDLAAAMAQPGVSSYYSTGVLRSGTVPIGRQGRYVRIQLAGTGYLSLAEVQVIKGTESSAPSRNVALGAATSQSSMYADMRPTRAQDNQTAGTATSGTMAHTAYEYQPWWHADLRASYNLTSIRIWNRTDCCTDRLSNFSVLVSSTPFVSTDLATARAQAGVSTYHVGQLSGRSVTIPVNRVARYVRVQLEGTNYLTLPEVQVYTDQPVSVPHPATTKAYLADKPFGMFIHYGLGTYTNQQWTTPGTSPTVFNPTNLDTDQWADAAKSAGMEFGVLTAKHHDGFALWDTAENSYDVMSSSYPHDVVREYVDSFRSRSLGVGLYYSIWDRTNGDSLEQSLNQLRELLTNYGFIEQIWFDGWGWHTPYTVVPNETVIDFIRNVSPGTVIVNNDKNYSLATTDVIEYEVSRPPAGSPLPTQQCHVIASTGEWFETDTTGAPRSTADIVSDYDFDKSNGYQYLLNVGPSDDGRMRPEYVQRLAEVGQAIGAA
ncbi:MAG TPA: alpha-L-fucosidase [Nocardioides sp.]